MSEFKFLILYISLLIFYTFLLGAMAEGLESEFNISPPTFPAFTGSLITDFVGMWGYFIGFIEYFITLLTITPEVTAITGLFLIAGIGALWIIITQLIIPLISAIGQLIPFT